MPNTEFRSAVDAMLVNKKQDRDHTYLHPSAFGGCPREIYFSTIGCESVVPHNSTKIRLFDNGHFVHLRNQLYARDAGILVKDTVAEIEQVDLDLGSGPKPRVMITGESGRQYPFGLTEYIWATGEPEDGPDWAGHLTPLWRLAVEMKPGDEWWLVEVPIFDEEHHFGGHCDLVVMNGGREAVVDYKGTSDWNFGYLYYNEDDTSGYQARYPDPHNALCFICGEPMRRGKDLCDHFIKNHEADLVVDRKYNVQLHIYMWLLGIDQAILWHENKNNQEVVDMEIEMDSELIDIIKKRSHKIWVRVQSATPPPRPKHPRKYKSRKAFPCGWCDVQSECWSKD